MKIINVSTLASRNGREWSVLILEDEEETYALVHFAGSLMTRRLFEDDPDTPFAIDPDGGPYLGLGHQFGNFRVVKIKHVKDEVFKLTLEKIPDGKNE